MDEDRSPSQVTPPSGADAPPRDKWESPQLERLNLDASRSGNKGAYEHTVYDS